MPLPISRICLYDQCRRVGAPLGSDDEGEADRGLTLDSLDGDGCTVLHVALLHGALECVKLCLDAGADFIIPCNGSSCLHLAVAAAGVQPRELTDAATGAIKALVDAGASVEAVDDGGRSVLHLIADSNLVALANALTAAADDMGVTVDVNAEDAVGRSPLHAAAHSGSGDMVSWLLARGAAVGKTDKLGNTPAHAAAVLGHAAVVDVLVPGSAVGSAKNAWGLTPAQALALHGGGGGGSGSDAASAASSSIRTLVLSHPSSMKHTTCNDLSRTGPPPPPENVKRLQVTIGEGSGTLRAPALASKLTWRTVAAPAKVRTSGRCRVVGTPGDCVVKLVGFGPTVGLFASDYGRPASTRVPVCKTRSGRVRVAARRRHDRSPRHRHGSVAVSDQDSVACHCSNGSRGCCVLCRLKGVRVGTIFVLVSVCDRSSWSAALYAAGSICEAIDAVVAGDASNAFCAVRPPGHHAGPVGVVTCSNDPDGSHVCALRRDWHRVGAVAPWSVL